MSTDILNTDTMDDAGKRRRKAEQVVNLGLLSNAILAASKLVAGILGHSQALLADGMNSVSDVIYFAVVKVLVRLSGRPADPEHPYGHHQFESIAALVVGAFVITTGAAIFWDSVNVAFDLMVGTAEALPIRTFALWVGLFTIVTKILLMTHAVGIARKTGNLAVGALARDHRNDIFSSIGATVGLSLSLFGLRWVDPLAGAVVAIVVAKTGFDILREASQELMDSVPSEEVEAGIRKHLSRLGGVGAVQEIHAHRFGPYLVVNLTIGVDGGLTVAQGDAIADQVEELLTREIEMVRKVYVHYHPTTVAAQGT